MYFPCGTRGPTSVPLCATIMTSPPLSLSVCDLPVSVLPSSSTPHLSDDRLVAPGSIRTESLPWINMSKDKTLCNDIFSLTENFTDILFSVCVLVAFSQKSVGVAEAEKIPKTKIFPI